MSCKHQNIRAISHDITLQLADSLGFPVENTQFIVTLEIQKVGKQVSINIPMINFQTGQISSAAPGPGPIPGGYLYTVDKFIPKEFRPAWKSAISCSSL